MADVNLKIEENLKTEEMPIPMISYIGNGFNSCVICTCNNVHVFNYDRQLHDGKSIYMIKSELSKFLKTSQIVAIKQYYYCDILKCFIGMGEKIGTETSMKYNSVVNLIQKHGSDEWEKLIYNTRIYNKINIQIYILKPFLYLSHLPTDEMEQVSDFIKKINNNYKHGMDINKYFDSKYLFKINLITGARIKYSFNKFSITTKSGKVMYFYDTPDGFYNDIK